MNISVLTPDRTIFTGSISSVTLPGIEGSFQLLNGHAPLVSALTGGRVELVPAAGGYRYFDENAGSVVNGSATGQAMVFTIDGGFVEVLHNEVNLLVQGTRNMR